MSDRDIKPDNDPLCAACGEGVACPESCCAVHDGERIWHEDCAPAHLLSEDRAVVIRARAERAKALR